MRATQALRGQCEGGVRGHELLAQRAAWPCNLVNRLPLLVCSPRFGATGRHRIGLGHVRPTLGKSFVNRSSGWPPRGQQPIVRLPLQGLISDPKTGAAVGPVGWDCGYHSWLPGVGWLPRSEQVFHHMALKTKLRPALPKVHVSGAPPLGLLVGILGA